MSMSMKPVRTDMLQFIKEQVLSISELTRTKKLTDILEMYAKSETCDTVFVVQNSRNKEAQAVIADLDYFQELLLYKEAVDQAIDQVMYEVALERQDDPADIPMAKLVSDLELDVDRIIELSEEEEI
ncbi:MAG TPA: hypothetical protein VFV52_09525 [Bacilli bacterium]|nr:hypothetical protein [Bacilli bacterium]